MAALSWVSRRVTLWRRRTAIALRPALVLTRREIIDTLRDWRMVVPIVVLATAFPFLANFAAQRGIAFINQYGGELILERLFPFLMLVVGFFPGTFSLVIALETFVGEKERRSMEPLLAAPLTDVQLYVGKLLAAVLPPLVASYLGMLLYVLLAGLWLEWWPSLELLSVLIAISTVQTLLMVTAAVIVSCQSTSSRAANLLASFIIIPMAFLLQVEAGLLLFANFTALWLIALGLLMLNILLIRLGIRVFSREYLLEQQIDTFSLARVWRVFREAAWPRGGLVHLYLREVPRLLRGIRNELLFVTAVILLGGLAVAAWGVWQYPLPLGLLSFESIVDLETIDLWVTQSGLLPGFSTRAVFLNNVRALLLAAGLGLFSLGIMAVLLLLAPMAIIGYIALQIGQVGFNPWMFLLVTVAPHGILELPAAILATAQAMRMGDVLLLPPDEGGGVLGVVREAGHFLKLFLACVLPLLLLAAWIEVRITPQLLLAFLARHAGG